MLQIEVKHEEKTEEQTSSVIRCYVWGCDSLKTFFITRNRNMILPKRSYLIMILGCKETENDVNIQDISIPNIGDIITDIKGIRLKIVTLKWA